MNEEQADTQKLECIYICNLFLHKILNFNRPGPKVAYVPPIQSGENWEDQVIVVPLHYIKKLRRQC